MAKKIVVYGIAKDEADNAAGFVFSAKDADLIVVGVDAEDVKTKQALLELGCQVIDLPKKEFRFDEARNYVLDHLPFDAEICISLDLDERLSEGWRKKVEEAWVYGTTRLIYWLEWSDKKRFYYDRIHARFDYEWRHANHEAVYNTRGFERPEHCGIVVRHLRDEAKDRTKNLRLLEKAVEQEPESPRMLWYLAREYYYLDRFTESLATFERYLEVGEWSEERCWARIFMSRITCNELHLHAAIRECQNYRDPIFELALFYLEQKKIKKALKEFHNARLIFDRSESFIETNGAYTSLFYAKYAEALFASGDRERALEAITRALRISPENLEYLELRNKYEDSNLRNREE